MFYAIVEISQLLALLLKYTFHNSSLITAHMYAHMSIVICTPSPSANPDADDPIDDDEVSHKPSMQACSIPALLTCTAEVEECHNILSKISHPMYPDILSFGGV